MNHFFVPQFIPRTLDELPPEPDEVTSLVYLEDSIAKELNAIRDYNRNERPLGQPPQADEAPSEPDDDAPLNSPPASGGSSDDFGNTESDDFDPDNDDDDAMVA